MTTVNDRIKMLYEASGFPSPHAFARVIGIHHGTFGSYLEDKTEPGERAISAICKTFPDLNKNWLISGSGEMWTQESLRIRVVPASTQKRLPLSVESIAADDVLVKTDKLQPKKKSVKTDPSAEMTTICSVDSAPYYNVDFDCGIVDVFNDETSIPACYITSTINRKGVTVWCNATGRSMEPTIYPGDLVALEKLDNPTQIIFGEIYAVVTTEHRAIKRICQGSTKDTWTLVSDNPNTAIYAPQEIDLCDVIAVFKVTGCTHKF